MIWDSWKRLPNITYAILVLFLGYCMTSASALSGTNLFKQPETDAVIAAVAIAS
jgi:hypothetical protein